MIKAKSGNTFLFVLTPENIERLQAKKPIIIKKGELPDLNSNLAILFAETLEDGIACIEEATGAKVPQFIAAKQRNKNDKPS